jgi:hypothetical protein
MTLQGIIDRAVDICLSKDVVEDPPDRSEEPMTAEIAWGNAVEELVKTDEEALTVLTELVNDDEMRNGMTYWEADYNDFAGFVRSLFYQCNEPMVARVKNAIPDYDELLARRKTLFVDA